MIKGPKGIGSQWLCPVTTLDTPGPRQFRSPKHVDDSCAMAARIRHFLWPLDICMMVGEQFESLDLTYQGVHHAHVMLDWGHAFIIITHYS